MHIKHIAIRVKDLEESIEFYETMTELKVLRRFKGGPSEVAFLANAEGETEIELIYTPEGATFEGQGMFICFETHEGKLEKMQHLAQDKGLNPSAIQTPGDGTSYFYVYDPNGVSVQLRAFPD